MVTPQGIYLEEKPQVGWWDEEKEMWRLDGISDVSTRAVVGMAVPRASGQRIWGRRGGRGAPIPRSVVVCRHCWTGRQAS